MKRAIFIFISIWIICGFIAAGSINATYRCEFQTLNTKRDYAQQQSFSLMIGLLGGPASLIVAAGVSGGFYDGWTLSRGQELSCK